jgi:hypothetical protein
MDGSRGTGLTRREFHAAALGGASCAALAGRAESADRFALRYILGSAL